MAVTRLGDYRKIAMAEDRAEYKTGDAPASSDKTLNFDFRRALRRALTGNEYLIYDAIIDRASEENGGWCWPSYTRITDDTGIKHAATIREAIKKFQELGLLEVQTDNGRGNRYRPAKPTRSLIDTLSKSDRVETKPSQKTIGGMSKNDRVPCQKLNTNVSKRTIPNNVREKAANAAPAPAEKKSEKPENPPVSKEALTAYQYYCDLFRRSPAAQPWFNHQVNEFGLRKVLAAVTRCYEKGLKTSAELRSVLERMNDAELACFDDHGKRIRSQPIAGRGSVPERPPGDGLPPLPSMLYPNDLPKSLEAKERTLRLQREKGKLSPEGEALLLKEIDAIKAHINATKATV